MILVIFDVDGTLVFSEKKDSQCFADTYQAVYDLPFPTIDWRKYPHVSDTTIFKTVIQEHFDRIPDEAEEESFRQQFVANIIENRKQTPTEFKEVPYAKQTIETIVFQPNRIQFHSIQPKKNRFDSKVFVKTGPHIVRGTWYIA